MKRSLIAAACGMLLASGTARAAPAVVQTTSGPQTAAPVQVYNSAGVAIDTFGGSAASTTATLTAVSPATIASANTYQQALAAGTGLNVTCNSAAHWLAPWSGVAVTQ